MAEKTWDMVYDSIMDLIKTVNDLRTEMHTEIGGLRSEMRTEIGGLRSEMHTEIGGLRSEMSARFDHVDERFDRVEARLDKIESDSTMLKVRQFDAENEIRILRERRI